MIKICNIKIKSSRKTPLYIVMILSIWSPYIESINCNQNSKYYEQPYFNYQDKSLWYWNRK